MRVLVVGAGGVGSAIATAANTAEGIEQVVIADVDGVRAAHAVAGLDEARFAAANVDAGSQSALEALIAYERIDAVVNACAPRFTPSILGAAFASGSTYLDMAMTLSEPHPDEPYERVGRALGEDQFAAGPAWEERGLLALVGMGVEPGLSDVFARYA